VQRSLEHALAIPGESDADSQQRSAQLRRLSARCRRSLFVADLLVMVLENALFVFFVVGMDSGLVVSATASALPTPGAWISS
jgi:hypothetical protein